MKPHMTLFIRSQDNLAVYRGSGSGHILTRPEVEKAFGADVLALVEQEGSVALPASKYEPSQTIRSRREDLGLTIPQLASLVGISVKEATSIEQTDYVGSIHILERVSIALGLDERLISFKPGAGGDPSLAARLKSLKNDRGFTPKVVSALADASWVLHTQKRLEKRHAHSLRDLGIRPSDNYGDRTYPAWRHGYFLAHETREKLGLSPTDPITSLRELCAHFGITVVKAKLPPTVAGATIASHDERGIVVNVVGQNTNVWVRRATIAHELGHFFWDPDPRLAQVTVDRYEDLSNLDRTRADHIEARANAFAIALLAPPSAIEDVFRDSTNQGDGVRKVMEHFGISFSAAKMHIQNILNLQLPVQMRLNDIDPTEDWIGREAFTEDYFPLNTTPLSRRGEFSAAVVEAQQAGEISEYTAAYYLHTSKEQYLAAAPQIRALFEQDGN